jgi:hypothetical protein
MSTVATLVLLPAALWDGTLFTSWRSPALQHAAHGELTPSLPFAGRLGEAFVAAWVLLALILNLRLLPPRVGLQIDAWTGFYQKWDPYGPSPPRKDVYPSFIAARRGKPPIDLWADDLGEDWAEVQALFSRYRMKQLFEFVVSVPSRPHPRTVHSHTIAWLCREWEARRPGDPLHSIAIYRRERPARSLGAGEFTRHLVREEQCPRGS